MKKYWYYVFNVLGGNRNGCSACCTEGDDFFPLVTICENMEKERKIHIMITFWAQISKEQYLSFGKRK